MGVGLRAASIREVQKSLKESAKRLVEDKIIEFGLGTQQGFKIYREVIETPGDGIITFTGMQDHTADSVKSMEGFHRAWVEEAQSLSDRSLQLLRPTIRAEQSELWFGWNPSRPTDPVDMMLRGSALPTGAVVVQANWKHNPWFPSVLEQERLDCIENTPERYGHIWEGEYATVLDGAYYAKCLTQAQLENRIGFIARDYLQKVYAIWDIGSSSRKADATSIWIVQFLGPEVRVLNYYEAIGQPFDAHIYWLRQNGYEDAICILPHDGKKHDTVYQVTPASYLNNAGFATQTVDNQGAGAAMQRVDAARLMFPNCRFNADTTEAGRDALGWYHEKRNKAGFGLGPDHDESSHAADAFGLVAIFRNLVMNTQSWGGGAIKRNLKGIA
jgi:phage terminase large subunit